MNLFMIAWFMMSPEEVQKNIHDYWWRLNNLYYIKNKAGEKVLFKPNPAQCDFNKNKTHLNIILKARQLGFSTFIDLMGFDLAFWTENKEVVIQAQDQPAAEKLFEEKIKFPYDNLPESLRTANPTVKSNTRQLKFANGSVIRVVTSARSGTTNFLHISEFGKICSKYPEKARETVTGSLNTVAPGQFIFLESTAEGRDGAFYKMTKRSMDDKVNGRKLSPSVYKFHFYPWYKDKTYNIDPEYITVTKEKQEYFKDLEVKTGVTLTAGQKAWYITKEEEQGEDMKREMPSTPEEAFEQAILGAYYSREMALMREQRRIRAIPYEPKLPVYTFWDLGRNDSTAIWFMQYHELNEEYRFINYLENSGESLQFYVRLLQKMSYVYAVHFLPHDADIVDLTSDKNISRADICRDLGLNVQVVSRVDDKNNAVQAVRDILGKCWFDDEHCDLGITALDQRHKEWDDKRGCFKDRPAHDAYSHGNDAFEQFARGFSPQTIGNYESSTDNSMIDDFDNSYFA